MGYVVRSDIPCGYAVSVIKWSAPHADSEAPKGCKANLALLDDHKQFRNLNVILIQVNVCNITLLLLISATTCLDSFHGGYHQINF